MEERPEDPKRVERVETVEEFVRLSREQVDLEVHLMDLRRLKGVSIAAGNSRKISAVGGVVSLPNVRITGRGHVTLTGFDGQVLKAEKANVHLESCKFDKTESSAIFSASNCQIGWFHTMSNSALTGCSLGKVTSEIDCRTTFRGCCLKIGDDGPVRILHGSVLFQDCMFQGPPGRWFQKWMGKRRLYLKEDDLPKAVITDGDYYVYQERCSFHNVRNNLREVRPVS